jgi:ABC-type Na+ efflux pump permease subunit
MRETVRSPLCRHETRAAVKATRGKAVHVAAMAVNACAIGILAAAVRADPLWAAIVTVLLGWSVLGFIVAAATLTVVWQSAASIAGEKEANTLEHLVLTPLDRRELIMAKLIGRTAPVRTFLGLAFPAVLAGTAALVIGYYGQGNFDLLRMLIAALVTAAIAWGVLLGTVHCVAGGALKSSERHKTVLSAGAEAYAMFVILPSCVGLLGLITAPMMGIGGLHDAINDFDKHVLREE